MLDCTLKLNSVNFKVQPNQIKRPVVTSFQQLISSDELYRILDAPNLIILDASIPPVGKKQGASHSWPHIVILNARRLSLDSDFSDLNNDLPHTMLSDSAFQKSARALGINKQSQIVVYDDQGMFSAARVWFMFKAMGHKNVAVLDGGLPQWLKQRKTVVKAEENQQLNIGDFEANAQEDYFCNWQHVEAEITAKKQVILDARSHRRFFGLDPEPRDGMRGGHIPTSKNLPYTELFDNGLLKNSSQLKNIFSALNSEDKAMIMTCGSGVTACILALAADILGYKNISVYDGSWSEWGASLSLPIISNK